jgi:lipoyl(octanoyl) transferase
MTTWHYTLEPEPLSGPRNMAVDEFLFRKAAESGGTFLRFYRWSGPTVSLGASQNVDKVLDAEACRRRGVAVVRRITGGKLVLHHEELTYCVASADTSVFPASVRESYRLISQALIRGLEEMGLRPRLAGNPPESYLRGIQPCFAHPARDEIEIDGKKIVGSAQKRSGAVFLQHGSLPLKKTDDLLQTVSRGTDGRPVLMTSLSEALGRPIDFFWAAGRLETGFRNIFSVELVPYDPARENPAALAELENRYALS